MMLSFRRVAMAGICAVGLLGLLGCGSAPRKDHSDDIERLRRERDRQVSDMDGKPVAPRAEPAPKKFPDAPTPREAPDVDEKARPMPDWVRTGRSRAHHAARYIAGVGSCRKAPGRSYETRLLAENRARDGVARNIRVRIKSHLTSEAKSLVDLASGEPDVKVNTTDVAMNLVSSTDVELEGVSIIDRWHDPDEDAYWALAVLDRTLAGESIIDRMTQLRNDVLRQHDLAKDFSKKGAAVTALRHYNRAQADIYGLLAYRAQLRVVAPAMARGKTPEVDEKRVTAIWRESALASKTVRVIVIAFQQDGKISKLSPAQGVAMSTMLRKLSLVSVKMPPPPAKDYEAMGKMEVRTLRYWAGDDANCLLVTSLGTELVDTAKLGSTTMYFYRGKGQATMIDLADGGVIAGASFELLAKTQTAKKTHRLAADGALASATEELAARLERGIGKALSIPGYGSEAGASK
jgi:LPP20 lipoprotein